MPALLTTPHPAAPALDPAAEDSYPLWEFLLPPGRFGERDRHSVSAAGSRLRFADGVDVVDATSGLWNVNLGYGNRAIADAVHAALLDASYLSLFRYSHRYALDAARQLVAAAGAGRYRRVLFATSGGSANDLAMKVARQYAALTGEPQRKLVVGFRGGYHGLTYGAFSVTGEDLGQQLYAVDLRNVRHVAADRPDELVRLLEREGHRVAAVVCEPVLGSGVLPLPAETLEALLRLRERYGYLVVVDEVATGFGRTGPLFASSAWTAAPDLLISSKGLTNGTCAAAAVLLSAAVCAAFEQHDALLVHGETQAGTPPTCAAICATLAEFRRLDALAAGARVAAQLDVLLAELADTVPLVAGSTGAGCFRGLRLAEADGTPFQADRVRQTVAAVRDAGALLHPGPGCVQLVPPLTSTEQDLADLGAALRAGLARVAGVRP